MASPSKYLILLVGAGRFELPTPSPPDWGSQADAFRSNIPGEKFRFELILLRAPACTHRIICSNLELSARTPLMREQNQRLGWGFCAKVSAAQKPLPLNAILCKAAHRPPPGKAVLAQGVMGSLSITAFMCRSCWRRHSATGTRVARRDRRSVR